MKKKYNDYELWKEDIKKLKNVWPLEKEGTEYCLYSKVGYGDEWEPQVASWDSKTNKGWIDPLPGKRNEDVINKIESFLSEAYEKTQGSKMELGEYYYRFQEVKEQLKNSKTGHEFWKNVEKCKEFFQWARGYLEKKIYSGNAAKFINVTKEAEADLMKIAKTFAKPNFAKLQDVNNIDFYEYVDRGKLMGLKDDERANRASSAWHRFD